MVKRVMAKLFKDELLKDFSYTGKKGKKKFCCLGCCSVIFGKYYIIIFTITINTHNGIDLINFGLYLVLKNTPMSHIS